MPTEAFITPTVVRWARNRCHLTLEDAARKINVDETIFSAWERGEVHPTFRQAESIAQRFYIPFGFLYLSEPPLLEVPLPDLRTIGDDPPTEFSPEFYDVVNDALRKQDWYKEYLENEGAASLPFIGRFTADSSVEDVASDLDATLDLSTDIRPGSRNWEVFLQEFIRKTEQIGILVLRNSVVGNNTHRPLKVGEFRGFVISDDLAPLIFLNGADAKSAQIFTLAHELAHLWIGRSGISNPDYRRLAAEQEHPIERVCDSIAAEVLAPKEEVLSRWMPSLSLVDNLRQLTFHFKVSRIVVLRRAFELERISDEEYWESYDNIRATGAATSAIIGGGNFYRNLLVRNSPTFANTVVNTVLDKRLTDREAARLLNVKVSTFNSFIEALPEIRS